MSKRILLTSLLVTVFVLLFFALASVEVYSGQAVTEAQENLKVYMNVYESGCGTTQEDAAALSSLLGGARVTIMNADGSVVADTAGIEPGTVLKDAEVRTAKTDGEGYASRAAADAGLTEVYYCKKLDEKLVRISVEITSALGTFARSLPTLAGFLVLDVALCLLFTWLATSFILRPVKELAQSAIGNDTEVKARYKELQPVADVINRKNESVRAARQSKDEFISNVTHEMNTPLTSVRGFAELIAAGALNKEKTQEAGQTIAAQSERLSAMIARILHYSEIDDDRLAPYEVDVSSVVRRQLGTYLPMLKEKELTLVSRIDDNVSFMTRHERITEILDNLVSNAIKYNKTGGSVTVTLKGRKLTVEDTGVGIPREELPHVFSRFYTVDKSHGENVGFGLGLAIVKKLCDRGGWRLSVDSTPNEGTTFEIEFA